ncbi:MAG: peptidylprolyl isomerase, partial [Phycisphaerae bacterium]|nr:peptidylprolyl isomerase [Phycisphaerae bacterium]
MRAEGRTIIRVYSTLSRGGGAIMKTLYAWLVHLLGRWLRPQTVPRPAPAFEALESRQLLSATVIGDIDDRTYGEAFDEDLAALTDIFDDTAIDGTVTRFDSVLGAVHVELFDQITPQSVSNFLNYVNDGDYNDPVAGDNFIHRSVSGFVVQGGGFNWDGSGPANSVPTDAPVVNEFQELVDHLGAGEPVNTRGTIAMAKVGGDPDSATSQWFFNLADNSANLDNQNGGFTTFGQVLFSGMDVVDQIAALPTTDAGGAFGSLPVIDFSGGELATENLVRFTDIATVGELSYEISNDRPDLVTVAIVDGQIRVTGPGNAAGVANVTVTATDLLGNSVSESFAVDVTPGNNPPAAADDDGVGFATDANTAFTTASVLDNDTDADPSDVLAVQDLDTTGTRGLVTSNGDGTFDYDPNGQFQAVAEGATATDSFSYTVSDGSGGTNTAAVTIVLAGINDAPSVADQSFDLADDSADGAVVGSVAAADPDDAAALAYAITGGTGAAAFAIDPDTGEITLADAAQLDPLATPSPTLDVELTDQGGLTATAAVTVNLVPPTVTPPTFTARASSIQSQLDTYMADDMLSDRRHRRLSRWVESAQSKFDLGRERAAVNHLTTFKNGLERLVKWRRLSATDAAGLIGLADEALADIAPPEPVRSPLRQLRTLRFFQAAPPWFGLRWWLRLP